MAPIKLEENIREKLQEREIQPSKNAWAKLEGQLEEEKRGNKFMWYAIAASFIGILIIASFVFKNDQNLDKTFVNENTVEKTKTEKNQEVKRKNTEKVIPSIQKNRVAAEEPINTTIESSEGIGKKTENTMQQAKAQKTESIALTETASKEDKEIKDIDPTSANNTSFEANQIEKVVAEVTALKNKNQDVTSSEIDALLKNAQQEIKMQRMVSNKQVDAMALLDDVEFEMEQGFREKVFMALGEGFDKIKTAVAERNN